MGCIACTSKNANQAIDAMADSLQIAKEDSAAERMINLKMAPYLSLKDGKYVFELTEEQAAELGVDSLHYRPAKALLDTFNIWIERNNISPQEVAEGKEVKLVNGSGDSIVVSFISEQEIQQLKDSAQVLLDH